MPQVIDATGRWVLPGFVDIHTRYDVEVLGGPGLPESMRHGVTTVLIGSCSLSTVHVGGVDAGDLFGRVEAIPREHVISAVDAAKNWTNATEYIAALESRPLGPNLAVFIGHSDMRTATMGLDRATARRSVPPTGSRPRWSGCSVTPSTRGSSECPPNSACCRLPTSNRTRSRSHSSVRLPAG
jgi:N-acyl-D-aspartate/D-glutamate deacylase